MSSFNLLGLGTQALRANQTALATVGQNISNVNTPGYSRQVANFTTLQDSNGVKIDDIDRITDQFLTQQLWADLASYNQTSTYSDLSGQLDNLLATQSTSVSSALDGYFSALQNVVDDPVSIPNRELFVAQSDALVQRFNNLDASIQRQNDTVNGTLSSLSSQVNSLSTNIAELNQDIKLQVAANNPANELRDQRDELTNQLSSLIGITVLEQGADNFSIFVANGEPLVMGITANRLETMPGDPDISQNSLVLRIANSTADVTTLLSGGKIGGLLEYRENALNAARDELGRIAIGFSESMNTAHRAGIDLNNKLGGDLFSDVNTSSLQSERISAAFGNQSVVSTARVEIQDATQLQASDYELFYASANEITLTRNSDGQQTKINLLAPAATEDVAKDEFYLDPAGKGLTFAIDGIKVSIETSTNLAKGDRFLIQPVRQGAENISLELTDGRQLALASPVRVTADTDNQGSGVASVAVTSPNDLKASRSSELEPPVSIVFNAPDVSVDPDAPMTYTIYDVSNASFPTVLDLGDGPLENIEYTEGAAVNLSGYEITVSNQPEPGDRFSFTFNQDGISDNRNALALSDLQKASTLDGGSYQDLYGSLVEKVGTRTATSRITVQANKAVLDSTVSAKASIAGVNLDEEAAKLVQFQQAYQASAQLIKASQTLFDTLLNSI
ncbi:flagellar hook-associated protein FlgK [Neptunomonas antarctica]|uniref:Flagellar hook-associated protein 1 n=1 Tax=Neptunomonas antarctica TaxID=619304 RepID=A0A1N7JBY1_9GAMM|nr:flagellar hook-associated protein FlgK [Neptunomonas antarctica]SIS46799.1 flagellar hook-associated protein 1 FlgK [Neptunomonas antarctica]